MISPQKFQRHQNANCSLLCKNSSKWLKYSFSFRIVFSERCSNVHQSITLITHETTKSQYKYWSNLTKRGKKMGKSKTIHRRIIKTKARTQSVTSCSWFDEAYCNINIKSKLIKTKNEKVHTHTSTRRRERGKIMNIIKWIQKDGYLWKGARCAPKWKSNSIWME